MNDLRFLVVGLGSMGKRRIRNLLEIRVGEIIGFDVRDDRRKQCEQLYNIKTYDNLKNALNAKPNAMIISTPPDKHKKFALAAAKRKIPFFTEVNTITPNQMQSIIDATKKNNVLGVPSSNVMFHPSVVKIKELISKKEIGKILTFSFHSGSYLPDWHPWEKLSDYYVYKKNTGGGRDQIMWELSWIYQLLGKPRLVTALTRKKGKFDAKIFDVYDLIIEFENNVIGHVIVDVIQRPPTRFCEIIGTEGTIRWEYDRKMVRLYNIQKRKWIEYYESSDYKGYKIEKTAKGFATKDRGFTESYVDEMKNFISLIRKNKKPKFAFHDEKLCLEIMYAAEKSSKRGIHVKIK